MNTFVTRITTLLFGVTLMFCSGAAMAGEAFFDTVLDKTISQSTPSKSVNLLGYKEFALLARFDGGVANANKAVVFEIGNNNLTVARETVHLNAQGWANFSKVYSVFAPNVGLAVYNPPSNLKATISIYAAH